MKTFVFIFLTFFSLNISLNLSLEYLRDEEYSSDFCESSKYLLIIPRVSTRKYIYSILITELPISANPKVSVR